MTYDDKNDAWNISFGCGRESGRAFPPLEGEILA